MCVLFLHYLMFIQCLIYCLVEEECPETIDKDLFDYFYSGYRINMNKYQGFDRVILELR